MIMPKHKRPITISNSWVVLIQCVSQLYLETKPRPPIADAVSRIHLIAAGRRASHRGPICEGQQFFLANSNRYDAQLMGRLRITLQAFRVLRIMIQSMLFVHQYMGSPNRCMSCLFLSILMLGTALKQHRESNLPLSFHGGSTAFRATWSSATLSSEGIHKGDEISKSPGHLAGTLEEDCA